MKRFILGLSMFLSGLLGNAVMLSGVATYTGNIVTEGAKWAARLEAVGLMGWFRVLEACWILGVIILIVDLTSSGVKGVKKYAEENQKYFKK